MGIKIESIILAEKGLEITSESVFGRCKVLQKCGTKGMTQRAGGYDETKKTPHQKGHCHGFRYTLGSLRTPSVKSSIGTP